MTAAPGIRVIVGDTTGFAHTADLTEAGLWPPPRRRPARPPARGGGGVREVALTRQDAAAPNEIAVLPEDVAKARKVDAAPPGRRRPPAAAGRAITQVTARYGDSRRRILIANSDGLLTEDDQVRTLFSVMAVASGDTGMQTGYQSLGRTVGFELFDTYDVDDLAREAAERALLEAGRPPRSVGHDAGGHRSRRRRGAVPRGLWPRPRGRPRGQGRLGVRRPHGRAGGRPADHPRRRRHDGRGVGLLRGRRRRQRWPARNVLIEDGILTDYMYDLLRSRKEGRPRSGNGRRQSYKHLPMVRMTNTYVLAGPDEPDDIIAGTPNGVYVAHLGGGQVNTATGDFVFGMTEAYLIEDGQITEPIREGNLIGNGPAVLASIDAVGHDFAMGSPGMCGKDGQGVPVGDGVPTLRVPALTVGGTA